MRVTLSANSRFPALAPLLIKAEVVQQASERRELAHLRNGYVLLVALAPAWCLFDAGGVLITDCIGGYANVFQTASVDLRISRNGRPGQREAV